MRGEEQNASKQHMALMSTPHQARQGKDGSIHETSTLYIIQMGSRRKLS